RTINMLDFLLAEEAGLYKKQGLEVEFETMAGLRSIRALETGEVDVIVSVGATVRARMQDQLALKVALLVHRNAPNWVMGRRGLNSVADLKGGSVQAGDRGSEPDVMVRRWLRENGLTPDEEVELSYEVSHPGWTDAGPAPAEDAAIARTLEREVLEVARRAGLELVEIDLPAGPYGALMTILLVEAASAFETLTLTDADDELVWQEPEAWPNTFRQTRFVPAIEYVQAQRLRREAMEMMAERFRSVEALISPSYAGGLLLVTNNTGHPSLTIRCGFKPDGTPHGITLWGRLFDEGTLCRIGMALESGLGVWDRRPGG
ncbi:MAG: ABC transporter substrate-binding protein, partial [Planctomycetes bacterium]|nr:ABC transporter substrate-binding protein [Planctomycetota bacterium]